MTPFLSSDPNTSSQSNQNSLLDELLTEPITQLLSSRCFLPSRTLTAAHIVFDGVVTCAYQPLHQVAEAFGDSAANERKTRHWFQKFRSGHLSLCDQARTGRPQAFDDEALQAAIEEDSNQTCGELARQFNTSSEMVRLPLDRLVKTYRLSKWVPHTLLEVHTQQRLAACLSLLSRHHSASIFNWVLTSDEN
ncbi:histone-lysine N-methyltransferase SETMAR [Trichonephila clavipes]|uniref:Histone-lysine N-methyltransferase SETMAR n=1 Tax=Trichonephila clavipes TaxID=2585209 RepID=A0A8X6RDI0_TRICX|nr:histone-lysine N-methyltransferase SETMAR [Trichonephila clavipes]